MIMRKMVRYFFQTAVVFAFLVIGGTVFAQKAHAQVVVNEISPASNPEWVELYNTGTTEVSLDGYKLNMGNGQEVEFSPTDTISGGGFKLIKQGANSGWSSNLLNNDGDTVSLIDPSGTTLSGGITYGDGGVCVPSSSQSVGRVSTVEGVDGTNTIDRFATPTEGSSNYGATLASCSVPESTETPTPSPSPSPTPTPTPKPTKTPTPKPSPTNQPIAGGPDQTQDDVLGLREQLNQEDDSNNQESSSTKSFPILAVVLIVLGSLFMGFGAYTFYKQKKGYTGRSERRKII